MLRKIHPTFKSTFRSRSEKQRLRIPFFNLKIEKDMCKCTLFKREVMGKQRDVQRDTTLAQVL